MLREGEAGEGSRGDQAEPSRIGRACQCACGEERPGNTSLGRDLGHQHRGVCQFCGHLGGVTVSIL